MVSKLPFEFDKEGLKYVAGWIAYKFRESYPDLGIQTWEVLHPPSGPDTSKWVTYLSRGGLRKPTNNLILAVYKMERLFCRYNKDGLKRGKLVIKNLYDLFCRRLPNLPKDLLLKVARTRTFIRLRHLNQKLKASVVRGVKTSCHHPLGM